MAWATGASHTAGVHRAQRWVPRRAEGQCGGWLQPTEAPAPSSPGPCPSTSLCVPGLSGGCLSQPPSPPQGLSLCVCVTQGHQGLGSGAAPSVASPSLTSLLRPSCHSLGTCSGALCPPQHGVLVAVGLPGERLRLPCPRPRCAQELGSSLTHVACWPSPPVPGLSQCRSLDTTGSQRCSSVSSAQLGLTGPRGSGDSHCLLGRSPAPSWPPGPRSLPVTKAPSSGLGLLGPRSTGPRSTDPRPPLRPTAAPWGPPGTAAAPLASTAGRRPWPPLAGRWLLSLLVSWWSAGPAWTWGGVSSSCCPLVPSPWDSRSRC